MGLITEIELEDPQTLEESAFATEPQRLRPPVHGKQMKVGIFSWQPGLLGETKSSAGGEGYVRFLIDVLRYQKYEVIWLASGPAVPARTIKGNAKDVDVALFLWRWEMKDYPERNALYKEQMDLLFQLDQLDIPIIIHDEDHKISPVDLKLLKEMGVMLTAPELNPRPGFRTLHYPSPWLYRNIFPWLKDYGLLHLEPWNRIPFMATTALTYVGNMYERYEQAKEFLNPLAKTSAVVQVYGNWLESGPNRPGKKVVTKEMPDVDFHGRLSMKMVVETLAQANSTIHLFKPSYGKTGFVTWRWIEAAAAQTPAFIPSNFWLPKGYKREFAKCGFIVNDGEDLLKKYETLTDANWRETVALQTQFVQEHCDIWRWLDLIDEAQEKK